ncbi:MAG: hypothetical protein CVV42_02470 [Candidatus Riflebacteria bacterium HGW-Riflebacteria-2]|jgi:hypothetical protein|nr:MAG: hypothetical protein CVV42_02470 [Candidatus Riflebacteria bacterium HGW-Riflebacteria-2]
MNRLSKVIICALVLFAGSLATLCYAAEAAANDTRPATEISWQPGETLVMMVGVLTWQDTSLATYTAENRYDQKLYGILRQRGVPAENIVFLKDKKATLAAIRRSLEKLLALSNERSTFMFYYTGHGEKSEDGSETFFLNYDCNTESLGQSSFSLSEMAKTLKSKFKGKQVILTADCCYSGNLNRVADTLGTAAINTMVLSSATAANESTGEWTFTKSLNEILNGTPLMKIDNLEITASAAADYIAHNMAYAEMQLANYHLTPRFPAKFVLTRLKAAIGKNKPSLGKYMIATDDGEEYKVRIIDQNGKACKISYVSLDGEPDVWRDYANLKPISWKTWSVGSKIEVEWENEWYPARVLKKEGSFHYIRYDDHEEVWNEWVAFDRIRDRS